MTEILNKQVSELSVEELQEALKKKQKDELINQKIKKRAYEERRDYLVDTTVDAFKDYQDKLVIFKSLTIALSNELHEEMYQVYNREKKELKQFSLTNEKGTRRLVVEQQEKLHFDETAEVAINQIKELLREKFANRNQKMYSLIDTILMKNKKGDYDERLVSKLRKHEADVNDVRFSEALDILSQAYKPEGSSLYLRAYERDTTTAKWKEISIQFSAL